MAQPSWDGTLADWANYFGTESLQELVANLTQLEARHRSLRGRVVIAVSAGTVLVQGLDIAGATHMLRTAGDGSVGIAGFEYATSNWRQISADINGRLELGGGIPQTPSSAFHRPAAATVATATLAAVAGKRLVIEAAQVILCPIAAQPAMVVTLADGTPTTLWETNLNAPAAGQPIIVPVPRAIGAVGQTVTLSTVAPAAGNFAAVFLSGYAVTP